MQRLQHASVLFLLLSASLRAAPDPVPYDPAEDAALVEAEAFHDVDGGDRGDSVLTMPASGDFRRYAASLWFPVASAGGREIFGGLRGEWLERDQGRLGAYEVGAGWVHRYALTGGMEAVKRPDQESYVMVVASWQGDFRRVDWDGAGSEWIYAHLFTRNPDCVWGLGLDLMRFYDRWLPYPLIFLEWWTHAPFHVPLTVRINGDLAEGRLFTHPKFCITGGFRYNLWYGSLGEASSFRLETVALEYGAEWRFRRDLSLRLKGKTHLFGEDALGGIGALDGIEGSIRDARGGSVRLALGWSP